MWFTRAGASARAYSSAQMTCCASVAPRPPCTTGHPSPMNPARPSSRSHATRASNPKSSSPGPPRPRSSANSPTTWASSQPALGNQRYRPVGAQYTAFASAVAQRYGRDVQEYILWNEPNLLVEHQRAVLEQPFRRGVDIGDVEAEMREPELVPPLRRRTDRPWLGELEQLDAQPVALDHLRDHDDVSTRLQRAVETGERVAVELVTVGGLEAETVAIEPHRPLEAAHAETDVRRRVVAAHVRTPLIRA